MLNFPHASGLKVLKLSEETTSEHKQSKESVSAYNPTPLFIVSFDCFVSFKPEFVPLNLFLEVVVTLALLHLLPFLFSVEVFNMLTHGQVEKSVGLVFVPLISGVNILFDLVIIIPSIYI